MKIIIKMSDMYKMYHAERMRAYRARLKASRPVMVKVKKQPMSVRERVRLYRERKKLLQTNPSLDSSVTGGDNMCLSSKNAQTVIVTAKPEKKPPMSAKERVRLYRQRQKELWEKYRASGLSVPVPSVSAENQCLNSANVQTRIVADKQVKKRPISVRDRVRLYRERKKQLQENQILDLSISAATRSEVSLNAGDSKKVHVKMCSASFPIFFFERLLDRDRADSQKRSDIISESANMKVMNTLDGINKRETNCKEDSRLQNQVIKGEDNNKEQKSNFHCVPVNECIKEEYEEEKAPAIKEEDEEGENDVYDEVDESTIATDYCNLVMEDEESLNDNRYLESCEEHSSEEDYVENEAENVDRLSFYSWHTTQGQFQRNEPAEKE